MEYYKIENIKIIDIDTSNVCNLECPSCERKILPEVIKKAEHIPFEKLQEVLDSFPGLRQINLIGAISEPTLYKHFFELMDYKLERDLQIFMSTNGSTHTPKFWKKLRTYLTPDDVIMFCIDGATQESHAKYRVNSSRDKVLNNHYLIKHYKTNWRPAKTILQYLLFKHNVKEDQEMVELYKKEKFDAFSAFYGDTFPGTGVEPRVEVEVANRLYQRKLDKKLKDPNWKPEIDCECPYEKYQRVFFNIRGGLRPCCHMNDISASKINMFDSTPQECMDYLNWIMANRDRIEECKMACSTEQPNTKDYEYEMAKKHGGNLLNRFNTLQEDLENITLREHK